MLRIGERLDARQFEEVALLAEVEFPGKRGTITYRIGGAGYVRTAVILNGKPLPFIREAAQYRTRVPRCQRKWCVSALPPARVS
jgi:hypothetical protein